MNTWDKLIPDRGRSMPGLFWKQQEGQCGEKKTVSQDEIREIIETTSCGPIKSNVKLCWTIERFWSEGWYQKYLKLQLTRSHTHPRYHLPYPVLFHVIYYFLIYFNLYVMFITYCVSSSYNLSFTKAEHLSFCFFYFVY